MSGGTSRQGLAAPAVGLGGATAWILSTTLACLFLLVDWAPRFVQLKHIYTDGDLTEQYQYQYFFSRVAYGTEYSNSGGPWGILYYSQYYPDTFWIMLAGQVVVALGVAMVLGVVVRAHIHHNLLRLCFLVGALGLLTTSRDAHYLFLILAAIIFIPDYRERRFDRVHLALMALLALSVLVKGTFMMGALPVLAAVGTAEIFRARRFPTTMTFFVVALLVMNAAAGQSPLGLIDQFVVMLDFSGGYLDIYSELGPANQLAAFLGLSSALGAIIVTVEIKRWGWWGVPTALGYAGVFFILLKTGFARADGVHVIRAICTLLPFGAVYLFVNQGILRPWLGRFGDEAFGHGRLGNSRTATLVGYALVGAVVATYFTVKDPAGKVDLLLAQVSGVKDVMVSGQGRFADRHAAELEGIRAAFPLPVLNEPVGIFSLVPTPALAYGLDLVALPNSSPYLMLTSKAVDAAAQVLLGSGAPPNVLFQTHGANKAWGLALLENYRPMALTNAFLVLEHRPVQRVTLELGGDAVAAWGVPLAVPAGADPVWASVRYRPTLLARALKFLFQPVPIYMTVFEGDRAVSRVRLNVGLAAQGILLSPYLNSRATFAALASLEGRGYLSERPVTSVRFEVGDAGSWLFKPEAVQRYVEPDIEVSFYRVRFAPSNDATISVAPEMQALQRLVQFRPAGNGQAPAIMDLPDGRPALAADAASPLRLPLAPQARRIELRYGLLADAPQAVTFRAFLDTGRVGEVPMMIWSSQLLNSGELTVVLDLPGSGRDGRTLLVNTDGTPDPTGAWPAYWSDARLIE